MTTAECVIVKFPSATSPQFSYKDLRTDPSAMFHAKIELRFYIPPDTK